MEEIRMEREKNKAMHLYKVKSEDYSQLLEQYNKLQENFDTLVKFKGEKFLTKVVHSISAQDTVDVV